MKPAVLIRIAAVLALVACLGHTFLFVTFVPTHGPEEVAVVAAMKSHSFHFGGLAPESYWELYFGYGLFVSISCLVEAAVLWQLAGMRHVRAIVAVFFAGEICWALLMLRYFFPVPIVVHTLIAVCLGLASLAPAGLPAPRDKMTETA